MTQDEHRRIQGVEKVIVELIDTEMEEGFGLCIDALEGHEYAALERAALLRIAKARLRTDGTASRAMKEAVELAVKFYGLGNSGWLQDCLEAGEL